MRLVIALALGMGCTGPGVIPPPEANPSPLVRDHGQASQQPEAQIDAGQPADEALFDQASALSSTGHHAEAHELYVRFLNESPGSKLAPNAWVALGDAAFEQSKWPDAERLYQQALTAPPLDNRVYGYAWYKLAFVFWNNGDGAKALNAILQTIQWAQRREGEPTATQLGRTALKDMLPIYAQAGEPTKAFNFFHSFAPQDTLDMMQGLGEQYWDEGKWASARALFEDLALRDPGHACAHRVWAKAASDTTAGPPAPPARIAHDVSLCP